MEMRYLWPGEPSLAGGNEYKLTDIKAPTSPSPSEGANCSVYHPHNLEFSAKTPATNAYSVSL